MVRPLVFAHQMPMASAIASACSSSSAAANSGNIYFQMTAPVSYQWVALGTGSGMSGSNIFVMYQDGKGNLTLSPRRGTFHTTPPLDTSSTGAKLTLLAGSGVSSDGKTMTANVACSNCQSWSGGGTMSLSSTGTGWISAWKSGGPLDSTNPGANIDQHDDTALFRLDLTQATIASDSNPFVASSGNSGGGNNGGGNGGNGGSGSGGGNGGGSGSGSGSGSNGGSGPGVTVVSASSINGSLLVAHGIIMALVMVILFPLGSMLMPLLGKWWFHAGWQSVTFLLMWAGFGLGVKCAQERNEVSFRSWGRPGDFTYLREEREDPVLTDLASFSSRRTHFSAPASYACSSSSRCSASYTTGSTQRRSRGVSSAMFIFGTAGL